MCTQTVSFRPGFGSCRNDLMVHVSFPEPTNEKVHQQCSRRVCAKTRSAGLVENQRLHTRFKASHAIFLFAECGPRFFQTWNCREERGLTVSFASTLSPCPFWSVHCMRVIATVWALTNRLAHTAGSFLIRSCREFSHPPLSKTASLTCCLKTHLGEVLDTIRLAPKMRKSICRIQVSMNFEKNHVS